MKGSSNEVRAQTFTRGPTSSTDHGQEVPRTQLSLPPDDYERQPHLGSAST